MLSSRLLLSLSLVLICSMLASAAGITPYTSPAKPSSRTDLYGDPLPEGAIARLGTLRWRHLRDPECVVLSPDGKLVASSGAYTSIVVWDATSGRRVDRFRDMPSANFVAFSPDGQRLLAAGRVRKGRDAYPILYTFAVETGRLLDEKQLSTERSQYYHGSFSADAGLLAITNSDGWVSVWETAGGKRLFLHEEKTKLRHLKAAISADGKRLATGSGPPNRIVTLWDIATGEKIRELPTDGHTFGLDFSPDGRWLVAVGDHIHVWDAASDKERWKAPARSRCAAVPFSPDSKTLVLDSGGLQLLEADTGKLIRRIGPPFPGENVQYLSFSRDGTVLLSAGPGNLVGVWDVASGRSLHATPGHRKWATSLDFAPDGKTLASGGRDGLLIQWDLASQRAIHQRGGHYAEVRSVAYSPDGQMIATGDGTDGDSGYEAPIRLWDVDPLALRRQWFGHLHAVRSLAFSPDSKTLVSSGGDNRARMWDASTGERIAQIREADNRFHPGSFSKDGKSLLTLDGGGIALYELSTGKHLRHILEPGITSSYQATFVAGSNRIAVTEVQRGVKRSFRPGPLQITGLDADTGNEIYAKPIVGEWCCFVTPALSRDGTLVAFCVLKDQSQRPSYVTVVDLIHGKELFELRAPEREFGAVALSSDGRVLATGESDGTVLLWDVFRLRLIHLWTDLGGDEKLAAPIPQILARTPVETIAFLKERLERIVEAEKPFVDVIAQLDDKDFKGRERASADLEAAGAKADTALRLALEADPSPEVRWRLRALLDKRKEISTAGHPRAAYRAIEVLELIGSPKAREILQALAEQSPSSRLARPAKEAIRRLGDKGKKP